MQAALQMNLVQLSTEKDRKAARARVKEVLKRYKKLDALIEQAEAAATGEGLSDRFQVSEEEFEYLATVGRVYTTGHRDPITRFQAVDLLDSLQGDDTEDQAALQRASDLLCGMSAHGGAVVWNERVVTEQRAMQLAAEEAERLKKEQAFVGRALDRLKSYAPHLEKLIRMRYLEGKTTTATAKALSVSARQQDNWHNDALDELAVLLRISRGY